MAFIARGLKTLICDGCYRLEYKLHEGGLNLFCCCSLLLFQVPWLALDTWGVTKYLLNGSQAWWRTPVIPLLGTEEGGSWFWGQPRLNKLCLKLKHKNPNKANICWMNEQNCCRCSFILGMWALSVGGMCDVPKSPSLVNLNWHRHPSLTSQTSSMLGINPELVHVTHMLYH